MKKLMIIIAILLILAATYFWINKNQLSNIEKAKTNALSQIIETNKQGDALIIDKPGYQIVYLKESDQFLLSIQKAPFEEIKKEAEQKFLQITQADKEALCQLNVKITTPFFANPDLAGQIFPLSFCQMTQ